MSKKNLGVLIIGCGGHARFVLSILNNIKYKVAGLINLGEGFNSKEVIMNTPVIGCRSSLLQFREQGFEEVILAIGDNAIREELYAEVIELDFKLPSIIHSSAILDASASKGQGNVIGPNVIIGAEVKIGSNNIINSLSAILCGAVSIGDGVFIGANSTVIDKVSLASHTIVGAGTNIIKSVYENGTTLMGNPGRVRK